MAARDKTLLACRSGLALIFLAAGIFKLSDISAFQNSVENYHLFTGDLPAILSWVVPPLEVILACVLMTLPREAAPPVLSALLSYTFLAVNTSAVIRGIDLECGCFGPVNLKVSGGSLAFNTLMLLASLYLASQTRSPRRSYSYVLSGVVALTFGLTLAGSTEANTLALLTTQHADASVQVEMSVSSLELGVVQVGETVRTKVYLKNTSNSPKRVTAIGVGCQCIKVWLPEATLTPGVRTPVIVNYTGGPKTGSFELGVGLKVEGIESPLRLKIKVTVPDPKTTSAQKKYFELNKSTNG